MTNIAIKNTSFSSLIYPLEMVDLSTANGKRLPGRVNFHFPSIFLWFSYGFPMVFLWFSYENIHFPMGLCIELTGHSDPSHVTSMSARQDPVSFSMTVTHRLIDRMEKVGDVRGRSDGVRGAFMMGVS